MTELPASTYRRAESLLPGNGPRLIGGGEGVAQFDAAGELAGFEPGPVPESGALNDQVACSPDGQRVVEVRDGDIFIRDLGDGGAARRVTEDGSPDRPYATRLDWYRVQRELAGVPQVPVVAWSPDSTRFVAERLDQSRVEVNHLLRVDPRDPRPQLVSYRDALPGDAELTTSELFVVDARSATATRVQMEPLEISMIQPVLFEQVWFSPDSSRIEAVFQSRDQRDARLVAIDPETGAVRIVAEERCETVVDPSPLPWEGRPAARVLDDGRGLMLSERSGWAHLWLVDGGSWTQLTDGEWVVRELLHVDEQGGEILFTATGREPDDDPVGRKLYRVGLRGGDPVLLTPEPVDHAITVSPTASRVVDNASGPLSPPVALLRDTRTGAVEKELSRADIGALEQAGWRAPERFTVTAADGETELHGLLYLPPEFDEKGSWPLLDLVYPGPQIGVLPRRFGLSEWQFDAYAALGIAVMALEGRGSPLRSKAFHDASYGRFESTPALEDHAAAVRQLAARRPWIDLRRVGIMGNSGGGYMAVRALIEEADTYCLAVAGVGNHDNRRYHAGWGERYIGLLDQDPQAWVRQSNVDLADRLRGQLLLGLAELDANVNPIATRALIAALVDADIDHEVIVVPGGDHAISEASPYYVRRVWDFLCRHLIGAEPPAYSIDAGSLPYPKLI